MQKEIAWYENEQKVEISSGADNLTLFIGSMEYYKNGEAKTLDVPAKIKDGRGIKRRKFQLVLICYNSKMKYPPPLRGGLIKV